MKQKVHYIYIEESRTWYLHGDGSTSIRMAHKAFIQRADNNDGTINNVCRSYRCSEASILRLAKIQEKLAQ